MGYFGLPSKACSPCRGRRIKCDLSTPACGQCVRSHRPCFGYRNPADLMFHDQSEDVACKAQRPKHASHRRKATELAVTFKDSEVALHPPKSLSISVENQAFCFFFNNYPSKASTTCRTMYAHIPAVYYSEPSGSPLVCVVTALGLAGLSCRTETTGFGIAASKWYEKALRKTNHSLRDRELATIDQTLLVVLLLGLYETNTCHIPGYKSIESALTHVRGATTLLSMRGQKQLESELGVALFLQARTQILIGCYQTRSSVPDIILQLSQKCHDKMVDPLGEIIHFVARFCDIRAEVCFTPAMDQSESTTRNNIAQYTAIAQAYREWLDGLSAGFLPVTVCAGSEDSEVLSGYYHCYEDIWIAGFANNYRANSILLHEALIGQLLFLQNNYSHDLNEALDLEEQIENSRREIISSVDAVCASVPGLLQSKAAAAGVGLLWTLFLIAQLSPWIVSVPDKTRRWIIGRLEKIGTELGVGQAKTLVALLRDKIEITTVVKVWQREI